jgi:acid phosphatase type 7
MRMFRRSVPLVWAIVALLLGLIPGCGPGIATEALPPTRETMLAVGKRLGRTKSPGELTEAAKRGDRVLALLTRVERDALGRGAIRFRVDRPTVVSVATPVGSVPFWLADQGFALTGATLRVEDHDWAVYRKSYPAGVIGLGVNSLDRLNPSHYAVFLRAEGSQPPVVVAIDPSSLRTVPLGEGVSPCLDGSRPFRSIPEALRGSNVLQTDPGAAFDGVLASGRVWKTHQPSGPTPDQVVVSFGEDPARQLSVTWRTDPSVKRSALRVSSKTGSTQVLHGDFQPLKADGLLNDPIILRHRVVATGLEPDTTYTYAVGDGSPGSWGPTHSVRTAPAKLRDFGFLYLGDAQCGLEKWGELLHAARKHRADAAFLLLAGDLVDRGNERTNWDHFFLRAAGVFEEIPFMPAVGNHEYLDKGPMIYSGTFDLPKNGPPEVDPNLVYSFEYSDAFVAVLDSNLGIYDSHLARVQAEWLDRALARTKATWKFVTFHHPVYASHVSRENPELGAAWGPVFDKHHVDMVLQGHDHAYLRTKPMRAGRAVASTTEGTVYVVSVSGEKFYDQRPREYGSKGITNVATYQTIDIQVKEKRLTYRAFDRDGREVDALVIEKGGSEAQLAGSAAP